MQSTQIKRQNHSQVTNGRDRKTRVISSNTWVTGESSNWRSDYHRFKGYTFAQVLKGKPKPLQAVTKNSGQIPTFSSQSVSSTQQPSKTIKVRCTSNPQPQVKKGSHLHTRGKVSHINKASQLAITNRYAPLQESDGVVLLQPRNDVACVNPDLDPLDTHSLVTKSVESHMSKGLTDPKYDAPMYSTVNSQARVKSHNHVVSHNPMEVEIQTNSKYDLPLRFKDRKLDYTNLMVSCPTLQLWDNRNAFKFGFIPMGDLDLPSVSRPSDVQAGPLTLHTMIKNSGQYNFKGCQINVKSQLNPDVWDELLVGYWDVQLPLLVRFGFPLDFDRNSSLESHPENHTSAKNFPDHVHAYLREEISYKAILGPFDQPPLEGLHTSPFMTREKSNSTNRRVIIDLSFPHGRSVNAGSARDVYLGTPFALKLPTIDHITKRIKSLGRRCMIYKIDIKRAFRHVKLDPKDYDLLGLHQDNWFLDTCLLFGFRHGSALFQRLSDAVRQRGHDVINYIDDILEIDLPSHVDASFDALSSLLEVSQNKLINPSMCVNCLGILVNTQDFTLSVPPEKMQEILQMCQAWHGKSHCTKRQLQSLLGSLLFISKCVRSATFFLNHLLQVLRSMHDRKQVPLSPEARRDINWFQKILPTFNGITIFDHRPIDHEIELDACLQGLGARWGSQIFAFPLPLGYLDYNIAHLEMLNILVALRVWHHYWAKSRVQIACDNEAVVHVLNSGRTRDLTLAAIARNIQLQIATCDINLQVVHIPGKDNQIPDLLSRWTIIEDPHSKLIRLLPHHE